MLIADGHDRGAVAARDQRPGDAPDAEGRDQQKHQQLGDPGLSGSSQDVEHRNANLAVSLTRARADIRRSLKQTRQEMKGLSREKLHKATAPPRRRCGEQKIGSDGTFRAAISLKRHPMMTWLALASEWQRDWARTEHAAELTEVLKAGSGIAYLWEQQLLNTPVPGNAG